MTEILKLSPNYDANCPFFDTQASYTMRGFWTFTNPPDIPPPGTTFSNITVLGDASFNTVGADNVNIGNALTTATTIRGLALDIAVNDIDFSAFSTIVFHTPVTFDQLVTFGGLVQMSGIPNAVKPDVLYYDVGTQMISYGSAGSGGSGVESYRNKQRCGAFLFGTNTTDGYTFQVNSVDVSSYSPTQLLFGSMAFGVGLILTSPAGHAELTGSSIALSVDTGDIDITTRATNNININGFSGGSLININMGTLLTGAVNIGAASVVTTLGSSSLRMPNLAQASAANVLYFDNITGVVSWDVAPGGGTAWLIGGNSALAGPASYFGTSDTSVLHMRTNNVQFMQVDAAQNMILDTVAVTWNATGAVVLFGPGTTNLQIGYTGLPFTMFADNYLLQTNAQIHLNSGTDTHIESATNMLVECTGVGTQVFGNLGHFTGVYGNSVDVYAAVGNAGFDADAVVFLGNSFALTINMGQTLATAINIGNALCTTTLTGGWIVHGTDIQMEGSVSARLDAAFGGAGNVDIANSNATHLELGNTSCAIDVSCTTFTHSGSGQFTANAPTVVLQVGGSPVFSALAASTDISSANAVVVSAGTGLTLNGVNFVHLGVGAALATTVTIGNVVAGSTCAINSSNLQVFSSATIKLWIPLAQQQFAPRPDHHSILETRLV